MAALEPVDESFFDTAPSRYARTFAIARPAAEVWDELTADRPLHWCRGLSARWTSSRPFGVGTTREATVLGVLTVSEHFFLWEEGRRQAFQATEATLPLFARLAEDVVVEPAGDERCALTWRAAIEPSTIGKLGAPASSLLFNGLFRDTARYFSVG